MNFISCAKWIRKGVAKCNPEKVKLTQEELQQIINSTRQQVNELDEDEENSAMEEDKPTTSTTDRFNLNDYDKEDESEKTLFGIGNLIVDEDEYVSGEEEYDSEDEDDKIKPTDNLIAVGHIDGDASVLEIYIYNEEDGYMYVHHDILLPAVPLCLEWLNYEPSVSKPGNLLAVGSMSCVISVWDLDMIDCLEPAYLLGKFSVKKKRNKGHGHKDAVLDLAWNESYRHILASGSVDKTVLLWDLDTGKASTTFAEFTDKVQSIQWRPNDNHLLLAGSGDKTAKLFDCRMTGIHSKWDFNDEIEKVAWCPWDNNIIYLGTNDGTLISYDIRQNKEHLWEVKAHEKEITGLELNINCPNLLVTCSMDEMVKIWNTETAPPKLQSSKSFSLEEMQCLDLNPDCPYVACMGGTKKKNNFKVVNLQHDMLQPVTEITANTLPVTFNKASSSRVNDQAMFSTENAFKTMSIKSKKIKSRKKYGHKFRNS